MRALHHQVGLRSGTLCTWGLLIYSVADLQKACELYCLCRQVYDDDRPMVGCDYCNGWYHYECVGLRAPKDDEEDEKVAPPDFRCPACCVQVSLLPTLPDVHEEAGLNCQTCWLISHNIGIKYSLIGWAWVCLGVECFLADDWLACQPLTCCFHLSEVST